VQIYINVINAAVLTVSTIILKGFGSRQFDRCKQGFV